MITDKTHNLFQFVDFLHANIKNFNKYNQVIWEMENASDLIFYLGKHYRNAKQKKALKKEIDEKWDAIIENIINPIKDKVTELDLFEWYKPETLLDIHLISVHNLSENFDDHDIEEIFKAKTQYIEFTNKIYSTIIDKDPLLFKYLNKVMSVIVNNFEDEGDKSINILDAFSEKDSNHIDSVLTYGDEEVDFETVCKEVENAIVNDKNKSAKIEHVYNRIELFTDEKTVAFGIDRSHLASLHNYKTDYIHFELLLKLTDDFNILYLEGKIDTLKHFKEKMLFKLKEFGRLENKEEYFLRNERAIAKDRRIAYIYYQKENLLRVKTSFITDAVETIDNLLNETAHNHIPLNTTLLPEKKEVETKPIAEPIKQLPVDNEKVDIDRLSKFFTPAFLGKNACKANYLTESLVSDVSELKNGMQVGQLALLIYESKQINRLKPKSFNRWHTIFCECIGKEKVDYKKGRLKNPSDDLKKMFHYLVPKNSK